MITTFEYLQPSALSDLRTTVAVAIPHLDWRYNGLGVLQAYLREGATDELRVHVWHPDLEKPGIRYSGSIHDHRFDLRSTVLLGSIGHIEYALTANPDGQWESHEVVNARKAMSDGSVYKAGYFDGQVDSCSEFFDVMMNGLRFGAGQSYRYPKFQFHETRLDGLCVTLVRKSNQEERKARILSPRGYEVTHAFAEPLPETAWRGLLEVARSQLLQLA